MLEFRNKKIAVLGMLDPGIATVRFLHKKGAKLKGFGVTTEKEKERIHSLLKGIPFEFHSPNIPSGALNDVAMIIQTPGSGRPYETEIAGAKRRGVTVMTDLELACQFYTAPTVAITGTNGKSSVMHMLQKIFGVAGKKTLVAGGDFQDFTEVLLDPKESEWVLLELSSSRLMRLTHFHPKVAVLLNISPGHSERHGSFDEYVASKTKIFAEQTEEDILVHQSSRFLNQILKELHPKAKTYPFSYLKPLTRGAFYSGNKEKQIVFISEGQEASYFDVGFPGLFGVPNLLNALAAVTIAKICAMPDRAIQEALRDFKGLPHRMEFVQAIEDVNYINDAKAVNTQGTLATLESFPNHSVLLIAGGEYKRKQFYQALTPALQQKVRCLIIFGEDRRKFIKKWENATETYTVPTLADAVQLASRKAEKGNTVLFSPATDPDKFVHPSVPQRGAEFKRWVGEIAELNKARRFFPQKR